ncbi:uncharacterized protein TRAVEDRAFT_54047 [Trametes versicolor FP-101664 SS1]|uniref:Uncharacterized protein n=1 Tax=Trametes versicolor (strain FP-101664) TaxID=717944 RepID=R7S7Q8_TRAVS|nr:uncharacterized protein TRAVEDRAFT_54047 [Trametes versicolor FP-101664 SS1]EIW52068.1 hypothetical protein TRAVEDRAFT_54047 [Trametes versicolor FP-101664 SS1]
MNQTSSSIHSPSPSTPDINDTIGLLYVGIMMAAVLYGVTLHQVHRYYTLYPRDFWWYRVLVPSLLVLETAHTILNADSYYYYLVTSHGSVTNILHYRLSLKLSIFVIGASMLLCQAFYASRIYLFGSRHFRHFAFTSVIFPLTVLFALAETGFALGLAAEAFSSSSILISVTHSWMISATYGSAVAVDTLITATMIYILLRSRTGFSNRMAQEIRGSVHELHQPEMCVTTLIPDHCGSHNI